MKLEKPYGAVLVIAALLAGSAADVSAQARGGMQIGLGAGISVITGTPERPAPRGDDKLTGASGPDLGIHVRALAQWEVGGSDRLLAGGEVFWNRLTSGTVSYNCLANHNESTPRPGGFCYPGAKTDDSYGALMSVRALTGGRTVRPMLSLSAGAARYTLKPDPYFEELDTIGNIRPVYAIGTGVVLNIRGIHAMLEGRFHASMGRGGGTHNIPITLSFLF